MYAFRCKSLAIVRSIVCCSLLTALAICGSEASGADAVSPVRIDKPLIAHWSFDEQTGDTCGDSSDAGHDASPARPDAPGFTREAGLFGGSLRFSGPHKLQVPGKPDFGNLPEIAFSVWTMPTGMDRYSEIFRKEDGDQRVLFSYQEKGAILSLGLNIGGYIECDAKLDPKQVLDGHWHHCAATFDGQFMRVYFDGHEIGSRERPGAIVAGGAAPGCIGSSNGGECFQGSMDELRIFRRSLTADEIQRLYHQGMESILRQHHEFDELFAGLFLPGTSFAETLTTWRKGLVEKGIQLAPVVTAPLAARLKVAFPQEFTNFVSVTGASPVDFLMARGNEFHVRHAGRLVEMMLEYRPLTDHQLQKQTAEEARKWSEAEAIEQRFERLRDAGEAKQYSPEWIDVMFAAGSRIEIRPQVHEAVAPYVRPQTPETRDLTPAEAQTALERDWLHQAGQNPSSDRILAEIGWTRQLAARIGAEYPGQIDFADELSSLGEMQQQAEQIPGVDRDLYFHVRRVKRTIALRNPVVNFDKMLFVDMPFPQGREWPHETRHRLGYQAVPGGRLMTLDGLGPHGHLTQLMPQPPLHGSFWRPDLSFDARKVLFSFKPHNEKSFHLYEINVDGTGLVQLTDGPYDDFDPIYLPDEQHIAFSTTRGHTYVRCMPPTNAYVLARCDRDGQNIYLISRNNEPDYLPSVMNDGRLIYTRWEYTDKPLWRAQGLWTVNPDGTQVNTFWGNQTVWPDLLKDARSIPGSRRVMFTGSAHHNWFSGSVGIIDQDQGFNFPKGLTKVTADLAWPESGNGPVDPVESTNYHASGQYAAYYSPYPLSETDFLVSANRGGKFVLYLMDVDGNRELIYEGTHNVFHAQPLRPRPRPPVVVDQVDWPTHEDRLDPKPGVIFSSNVYYGAPDELRNKAKYLRVLNIEHKTYTYWYKRPYISTGPVVSAVQSEGVKQVLGTVPIESDGSVAFSAPPGIPLHFQLLDENYRALQTMRSFTGVMPGEQRGCLGCHESHSATPELRVKADAFSKPPQPITPPPWGNDTVSYMRYVQPVLDQYCGKCHQGDGKGRKTLDLTVRPGFLIFNEPYMTLIGKPSWGRAYAKPEDPPPGFGIANMLMVEGYDQRDPQAYRTPKPMTHLSYRSRLIEIASSGKHHDVKVDPVSLRRLIAWVDTMCPYRGAEEVREIDDPEFQGVDWLSIRPRIKTAPRIVRPGPVD